ncbi:hypothetical protein [Pseudoruegeria sp. SK021]|uniref:hypothetical protein n=1 Tax=Pseudoruegeria sp. SK021 TaxID=1933035 RepID=UPI00143DED78|nr:hypothetical protein [Pseudoruegeria sp. SK021]
MMGVLWFLLIGALTVYPLFKLLPKYKLNPWWSVVAILPVGLIILLWMMAARADE